MLRRQQRSARRHVSTLAGRPSEQDEFQEGQLLQGSLGRAGHRGWAHGKLRYYSEKETISAASIHNNIVRRRPGRRMVWRKPWQWLGYLFKVT